MLLMCEMFLLAPVPHAYDVFSPAGDALRNEREEKASLQSVTSVLKSRIANMAATREAHNKQLSSQIDKLRSQLDKSKKVQHESQHQVRSSKSILE
jgi:hypothetical protein